jgi:hypothetical protein
MRLAKHTLVIWMALAATLAVAGQSVARAAVQQTSAQTGVAGGSEAVDGIAARIEDDITTESEVRELSAFQRLVDGQNKQRAELIRELADQWITRGEADAAKFPKPSATDVQNAYAQLAMQFGGVNELNIRAAAVGLNEAAVRRLLEQQLYLSRFLDYRFRPAVQIDDAQIETYYNDEFVPQVKERGEQVPPLESVEETIREVLVQRAITQRADQWLDDTRARLQVETLGEGGKR